MSEQEVSTTITLGDGTIVDSETGEIMGFADAPKDLTTQEPNYYLELEARAEWLGERRTYHISKSAGLRAEKEEYQLKLNARFDSEIARHENATEWLEKRYQASMLTLAQKQRERGQKGKLGAGLLILKINKSRAKTDVMDTQLACAWAYNRCPQALRVSVEGMGENAKKLFDMATSDADNGLTHKMEILKGSIPEELRETFAPATNGLYYYKGGEETIEYK